jgi:ankyrin repeat protein
MEGDIETAEKILEDKLVDVTFKDSAGWTPLHYAVRRGYNSIIPQLLRNIERTDGAVGDIAVREDLPQGVTTRMAVQDDMGQQCIHLAAERGDCKLLYSPEKFLTEHLVCKDGQTALHRAVLGGSLEMTTMLLNGLGDDVKDTQDSQGRTALHLSVQLGQGKIFTELLSKKANPLLKDNRGRTTLHYAAMDWNNTADRDMISILLDYDELNVPDSDGRMPIHYAAETGCGRYIKLLSRKTNLAKADSS